MFYMSVLLAVISWFFAYLLWSYPFGEKTLFWFAIILVAIMVNSAHYLFTGHYF